MIWPIIFGISLLILGLIVGAAVVVGIFAYAFGRGPTGRS